MNKAKVIIAILILIAGLFGYAIGKYSTRVLPTNNTTQLNLPYEQVKVSGIDSTQQKQIEDFIGKFYEHQQQKEVDKILALFTPPSNKQEQDDLDFLLGKDLARISAKPQMRLFTTQGYNYKLGGYYIRDITRHNDAITVLVDEMRVIYSGGEYIGFSANIARLNIEMVNIASGFKIKSYNHQQTNKKYEGFKGY